LWFTNLSKTVFFCAVFSFFFSSNMVYAVDFEDSMEEEEHLESRARAEMDEMEDTEFDMGDAPPPTDTEAQQGDLTEAGSEAEAWREINGIEDKTAERTSSDSVANEKVSAKEAAGDEDVITDKGDDQEGVFESDSGKEMKMVEDKDADEGDGD